MDFLTEKLLKRNAFDYCDIDKKNGGIFFKALKEELIFHYENNKKYRRFCRNKGFNPFDFDGDYTQIPPVQVAVFKELGRQLASVPAKDIKLTLQSSATSGIPSSIPVDKLTAKRQAKAMVKVIGAAIGNDRKPFLVMDVNPSEGFREILGARYAAVTGYLNFASSTGYFLKVNKDNKYYFDIEAMRKYIAELDPNIPTVVFGFTYILFSEIIKPLKQLDITFKLPHGSKIIHIGGWKKLESEKVIKQEFNQEAASLFGVNSTDVIDIYGFTEQMGINYPECACGCKHTPLYSDVIVRDTVTKKPLPNGQIGLLEFLSPIPHSYPGNAVLTDDLGVIEDGVCPYGRVGKRFKMLGRLKKAEIRGCGDILSNKLKFAVSSDLPHSSNTTKYDIVYYPNKEQFEGMEPEKSIKAIEVRLRNKLEWLRRQPVDALIGLIAQAATKWKINNVASSKLQKLNTSGLGFLANWCTVEHLSQILTEGLNGNRKYIDTFLPVSDNSVQLRKATSRGLACHWLAGNVQVLGMFVLIESILCKNVNLMKLSSRDDGVFAELLEAFKGQKYTTKGGYTIFGDELLETVALIYYEHNSENFGKAMSRMADIRIAWGGKESVMTVSGYPSNYDCQDLIMGPKLSFSVVSKEFIDNDHAAKKLARKIAVDASVFDQTGCASSHNVFVERGGNISPETFANYLAEGMKKTAIQIPKGSMSTEQIAAIHSARGIYDFKGMVLGDEDNIWTVLYSEDVELNDPVYSRVVFVHPVDDINDAVQYVNDNIQTIGLAAMGEKAIDFAIKASDAGALRFPVCGRMLNFDSPWDGMYLTDKMVKWITIGGPSV